MGEAKHIINKLSMMTTLCVDQITFRAQPNWQWKCVFKQSNLGFAYEIN